MRNFRSRWPDSVVHLANAGFTTDDAYALRRIAMTLHRWHELECGDGNSYGSWAIVRGNKHRITKPAASTPCTEFVHDDDGAPYLEHHHYLHGRGKDTVSYTKLADRERGALKRLAKIMAKYPGFAYYVQTDPRGCALYIMTPEVLAGLPNEKGASERNLDGYYSRGIAVYR